MEINLNRDHDQQLTLKGKPETFLLIFISIWGSMFAGMPLLNLPFILYYSLNSIGTKTIECQHLSPQQVNCVQTQETFLGLGKKQQETWTNITKAEFHSVIEKSKKSSYERIFIKLKTPDKEMTVFGNKLNFSKEELQAWVKKFNEFIISDSQEKITLTYPISGQLYELLPVGFILIFPITGIFVIHIILQWDWLIFDRINQQLIWKKRTIFGLTIREYQLIDVTSIKLLKTRGSKGGTFYHLKIYISGKDNPINLITNSFSSVQNTAKELGNFLEIPVIDITDMWS